ncbi:MAG TPA: hypothetical protein VFQ61_15105 [Polyangiaceae bacterium]|nr:hypothetical protein [Polyangiaceae bacterium]
MVPLFFSCVCDYCENPRFDGFFRGYVVWRGRAGESDYVFPTREYAERFQRARGLYQNEIRLVLSRDPFHFRKSTGTLKDLEFADRLFEIYPDHRFQPGPGRAFLSPASMTC